VARAVQSQHVMMHERCDRDLRIEARADLRLVAVAAVGLALALLAANGGCGGIGGGTDSGGPDGGASPTPCETALDCAEPGAPVCVEGICRQCEISADCTAIAGAPICDVEELLCRGCASQSECGSLACDLDGSCRGCTENDDCDSLVCERETGACVDEAEIIYANSDSGADGPSCGTRAAPCQTLVGTEGALAWLGDERRTVKLLGSAYFVGQLLLQDVSVAIVGPATIVPSEPTKPTVSIRGSTEASFDEVTITDGGTAINVAFGGSSLTLFRSFLVGNSTAGISAVDCVMKVLETTVSGAGSGIRAQSGSSLTLQGSTLAGNRNGGLLLTNSAFDVRNNFIVENGDGGSRGSSFGGVSVITATNSDIFAYNTVSRNLASPGNLPGIACSIYSTELVASGNIVHDGGSEPVASDECRFEYSNIQGGAAGRGNIDQDPLFVSAAEGDLHLQSGSPAIDAADPLSSPAVDIDGDARPHGVGPDMGADELVP
jgi:hypothetical protein